MNLGERIMEEEVTIFALADLEPVVTTVALGDFSGQISVTTTRIDKGDDTGAGLFYVDVSVSDSIPSFGSYNILNSSDSNDFISLTDVNSKDTASSGGTSGSWNRNCKRQLYVHNDVLRFLVRGDDHDHDSYVSYDDEKEEKEEDDASLEEEGEEEEDDL